MILSSPSAPDLRSELTHTSELRLDDEETYSQLLVDTADLANQSVRGTTFEQVEFRHVSLAGTDFVEAKLTDVVLDGCDLAGAVWHDVSFLRVRFVGCRVSAFALNRCSLVDIQIVDCRGECASVFESEGRRWLTSGCDLSELDARGLRLSDARFDDCRLASSQWGHAKLERVMFGRCDLSDAGGPGGLGQSQFDTVTLVTVAPALARNLGIAVTDEDD